MCKFCVGLIFLQMVYAESISMVPIRKRCMKIKTCEMQYFFCKMPTTYKINSTIYVQKLKQHKINFV